MACGTRPQPPRPDAGTAPEPTPSGGFVLRTRSGVLSLERAAVMGVLNATPDSFVASSRLLDPGAAADTARAMVAAGAALLDLGAESTRPGASPVPEGEERRRLVPVLRAVRAAVAVPLAVDTMKASVARAALDEGADLVNDVSAGCADPEMLPLCAATQMPIVLMHMQGEPATMQDSPQYTDVVGEIVAFLGARATAAEQAGVARTAIVLDPGIGFGKTVEHNLTLLRRLDLVVALGYPVLVGVSRKGFLGTLLGGRPADERVFGTAAAVALAVAAGARLIRVHDVGAMRDVVTVAEAVARA